MGLPEGLVMLGVPPATLTTSAWSSSFLGDRDTPHTNSALCRGLRCRASPSPASAQHEQLSGDSSPCMVAGPRDKAVISGAGCEGAVLNPYLFPVQRSFGFSACFFCTQGLSCGIFNYLEHPWRGSSF